MLAFFGENEPKFVFIEGGLALIADAGQHLDDLPGKIFFGGSAQKPHERSHGWFSWPLLGFFAGVAQAAQHAADGP